jgi:hypothetical protein
MLEAGGAGSKGLRPSNLARRGLTGPSGHSAFDRVRWPSARALPSCKSVLILLYPSRGGARARVTHEFAMLPTPRCAVGRGRAEQTQLVIPAKPEWHRAGITNESSGRR